MKTLHLLRHAKSSWSQPGLADRERGLNKRGRRDAPRMGAALATQVTAISIAVSPARRAQLTLDGLCQGWPALAALPHVTDEGLYTFASEDVLSWIQAQDDSRSELFIIGHNPAFTELINALAGRWELDNLPTCAYARLDLDAGHWREVGPGCAELAQTLLPRLLDEG
ncbi:phosphoglycerate mutase [Halioglobus maricola]|uniref:Phosphoglycerate mutase n=1 Tax=Halioglobus maricola TaxID=2601894 RepID=A0A5P9NFH3_9GAMM|nr:histidine phosphatase family protein [Halioglobus maricola]QFU74533.1 phosphoglycerate mutase [Halioglobus maricola]